MNGSILNALLSAYLVLLGSVPYRLAILQDITARKQAETRIAAQLDELRRWYDATSDRERRILDLKHEANGWLRPGNHRAIPARNRIPGDIRMFNLAKLRSIYVR